MIHPQLAPRSPSVVCDWFPPPPCGHDNFCPCCGAPRNRSFPSQLPQYAPPTKFWGGLTTTTSHPLADAAQHAHATASDSVFSIFH